MAKRDTATILKELILDLGADSLTIKPETKLVDLGFDSLDCVELVMMVEEEFKLQITDEDAEQLETFQHCVDFIEKRL